MTFAWRVEENLVTFAPEPSDWYVTVDERVGSVFGLVASPWPTVDQNGVLQFDDVTETACRSVDGDAGRDGRSPCGRESRGCARAGPVDHERLFAADDRRADDAPADARGDDGPPPPAGPGFASPGV